ncbi:MAG TPA: dipeptide ABC transporter ATP-binding protein [Bacillota bacterium]|jgi:oligopeptide/dipeptide ABC transporter ATP-binding protein
MSLPAERLTAPDESQGPAPTAEHLVEVRNLVKWFPIMGGIISRPVAHVKAVDDVSFTIGRRETLGLVGESGCGKTTVARTMLRLIEPDSGEIWFDGSDLMKLNRSELRRLRPKMQVIFQDPYASLNPRLTVMDIVGEAMAFHRIARGKERDRRVMDLLDKVGLQPSHARRFPHEFSGGQRQRIGIARALAMNPELIVADEPVSALDVSIQSQILNLLADLQEEFGVTYLFIAHGLHVVKHVADRIGVMYLGKLVEVAPGEELYQHPLHPYTRALVSAIPIPNPKRRRERIILEGDVPSPVNPPSGCRFHTRCSYAVERCKQEEPVLRQLGPNHEAACHLA